MISKWSLKIKIICSQSFIVDSPLPILRTMSNNKMEKDLRINQNHIKRIKKRLSKRTKSLIPDLRWVKPKLKTSPKVFKLRIKTLRF